MPSLLCLRTLVTAVFVLSVQGQVVCCEKDEVCTPRTTATESTTVFQCTNSLAVIGTLLFLSVIVIFALLIMATLQTLRLKSAQRVGAVPLMVRTISLDRREWTFPLHQCTCTCGSRLLCCLQYPAPILCLCIPRPVHIIIH